MALKVTYIRLIGLDPLGGPGTLLCMTCLQHSDLKSGIDEVVFSDNPNQVICERCGKKSQSKEKKDGLD